MANTVWNGSDKTASVTLTGSNLIATSVGTGAVRAVDRQVTGKYYWEVTLTTADPSYGTGIANPNAVLGTLYAAPTGAAIVYASGQIWANNVNTGLTLGSLAAGGIVLCLAVDTDARRFWARSGAAGNWNGNVANNPATGVGGVDIAAVGGYAIPFYPAACFSTATHAVTANFGDTAFVGAVPSGYTSGFTAGASVPTNAIASQALAEHWLTTNPQAQITQVVLEHWMSVAEGVPVVPSLDTRVMVLA